MTSFLPPHTTISMRQHSPSNKDAESIDLDQLFGQYVETDLLHSFSDNSTTAEPSSSDPLAHLFELPEPNGSDSYESSALSNWDADDVAWQKAIHHQNPALPYSSPLITVSTAESTTAVYPQSRGKACLSDPGLFALNALFEFDKLEPRAISQPSTPKPLPARPPKNPRSSPDRSVRSNGIQKQHTSAKKSSLSSFVGKMLRPSHYRAGFQDLFTRRMDSAPDHFNIAIPPNGLHSPPPSTKMLQSESTEGFFVRNHAQPYTLANDDALTSPDLPQNNYQLTPLSSPALDTNSARNGSGNHIQYSQSSDGMAGAYFSHHLNSSTAALAALQTPPASHGLSMSTWGADTSPNIDFGSFSASPEFGASGSGKAEGWWSGPAPVTQPASPGSTNCYSTTRAGQDMNFTTASVAGLGISCDSASFPGFGGEVNGGANGASSFELGSYSSIYGPSTPGIPIGTTPANPRSSSRSPSPSPQPRFTRRRHPVSSHTYSAQQLPTHSSRTSQSHRRKSSNSSTQSRNGSLSTGGSGFVNFTPSDSRKILTGVAPSGSSKTKARREKEAADKRRKLSQAAVRAVVEAGGDLGRLEKEILVLES